MTVVDPTVRDEALVTRMRAAVAAAVADRAAKLAKMSAPALVGVLSASALAPLIAVAGGAGTVLAAGAGVLGSVGANILTGVVTDAITRLRVVDGGADPRPMQIQRAVADRIEAAFRSADPADRDLRGEVVGLFQAVDVAGTALRAAADSADDQDLVSAMVGTFVELTTMYEEFAFALVASRLSLERLHQDVREEVARQSADRERVRRAEADIGVILDVVRDLQSRQPPATPAASAYGSRPTWDGCPYRGLLPFEERDATVFYGRRAAVSRMVSRLAERLASGGMTLVLGPSGAGKSSLLRAGLLPALADDRLTPGCRTWPRRVITPTADPLRELATHLADLAGTDAISVYQSLTDHPEQAHLLATQTLTRLPSWSASDPAGTTSPSPRLVLVVDQLEELFTLVDDRPRQAAFLVALHAMANNPTRSGGQPAALVVAGIRSDFLEQATTFAPLREAIEAGPFTVGAMTESELAEAITGPAAEAGVSVADELTRVILDDLRERSLPIGFDSGALPLLSQVMFVMWETGHAGGLTVEGYRRAGGVADIVHTSAERVYQELTSAQQDLTHRVFVHLTATADGRLTRRPAPRAALRVAAGCNEDELDTVLEPFTAQRLITRTDRDLVVIAHEELLHSWTRLRDWLQPNVTDQALHRALIDDVQAWVDHERDSSYLYRGGQLLVIQDATKRWGTDPAQQLPVNQTAMEFLTTSHRRNQRRRRIYQAVTAAMLTLIVVAVGAAVVANGNADLADRQHALALSRQLAAQSRTLSSTRWVTAQRLATAALHVAQTEEARDIASVLLADYPNWLSHTGPVHAVVFSRNGKLLATGSADATVRLWNPKTGSPIGAPLTGHKGPVTGLAFSSDGKLLATGSADATVRLWNPKTGSPIGAPLTGHKEPVTGLAFSSGGRHLFTATLREGLRLWDVSTRNPVDDLLTGHNRPATEMALSPDGRQLAGISSEGRVAISELERSTHADLPLPGLSGPVTEMALSSEGERLATANDDGMVQLWFRDSSTEVKPVLTGHTNTVTDMAFSPDGELLATASADKTVRLWDVSRGKPVGMPPISYPVEMADTVNVDDVVFSPDGRLLAAADLPEAAHAWNAGTGKPAGAPRSIHTGGAVYAKISPNGQLLATTKYPEGIRLWDVSTGKPVGDPLAVPENWYLDMLFSPDGQFLATEGADETVRLWDVSTGKPVGDPLTIHTGPAGDMAFSSNGRLLATEGANETVRLWDVSTGKPVGDPLTIHTGPVAEIALSSNGRLLATAGDDKTARLWDTNTGKPVGIPLAGHTDTVTDIAFSPNGRLLATAGDDKTARLWDTNTSKPVGIPLAGHTDTVADIAFSPNGQLLATAGDDKTARLWETAIYSNPMSRLCETAGGITEAEWSEFAKSEPFVKVCP